MSIRTTVSLDEDVIARLREASRLNGKPFRTMLNEAIRSGLTAMSSGEQRKPFRIKSVNMGEPTMNFDNVAELIERLEGESHR